MVACACARADPARGAPLASALRRLHRPARNGPPDPPHSRAAGAPARVLGLRRARRAAAALRLEGGQRVLDVACGPGDFTSFSASRLTGDGFVIGVDDSVQMLQRAANHNSHDRVVYMRADTLGLPLTTARSTPCVVSARFISCRSRWVC